MPSSREDSTRGREPSLSSERSLVRLAVAPRADGRRPSACDRRTAPEPPKPYSRGPGGARWSPRSDGNARDRRREKKGLQRDARHHERRTPRRNPSARRRRSSRSAAAASRCSTRTPACKSGSNRNHRTVPALRSRARRQDGQRAARGGAGDSARRARARLEVAQRLVPLRRPIQRSAPERPVGLRCGAKRLRFIPDPPHDVIVDGRHRFGDLTGTTPDMVKLFGVLHRLARAPCRS